GAGRGGGRSAAPRERRGAQGRAGGRRRRGGEPRGRDRLATPMAPGLAASKGRFRRLVGLDRSGPRPRQTRRGEPLRPLTLPNLVGYLRLAGVPVFLYLALGSGDGRSTPATLIYLFVIGGDYLDGFLARATGQYSRLGP